MPQKTAYRPTSTAPTTTVPAERRGTDTLVTTNDILDEIDAILIEEEDFAVRYLQKGGQ